MTREEIARRLDEISNEVYTLGTYCTDLYLENSLDQRTWIVAEYLKNSSHIMDTMAKNITNIKEEYDN